MSAERPIPFSAPMVQALMAGTKTQTRRACKPAQAHNLTSVVEVPDPQERGQTYNGSHFGDEEGDIHFPCPYGGNGERLWVREAFRFTAPFDSDSPSRVGERCLDAGYKKPWAPVQFEADKARQNWIEVGTPTFPPKAITAGKLRPGMFMPRWTSRILLEISAVRVQRLQDISTADALAEGIVRQPDGGYGLADTTHYHFADPRFSFWSLWESINGAGCVEANPWVWALTFQRVEGFKP